MHTSLERIASKAQRKKKYRYQNLYGMLNEELLEYSWRCLNKNAAAGVDKISYHEYDDNVSENIPGLVKRLKEKRYRAKLVRRQYIPKGGGKMRPLGIPAIEDKLLQYAVLLILQAIYEQDFLPNSYGYRPGRGAKDAVKEIRETLEVGNYNYVVEADIEGYFDTIDHEWLITMMEQRIDDRPFLRLIRKWLKAGVMDTDGKVIHPLRGTPQGGIISPMLSNIYMHYVLVLWFERVVKKYCKGEAHLWVYADDFVCAFTHRKDAERFYEALEKRLGKFGLTLSFDKTHIIEFTRKTGNSFDFLGFEFRLARTGKRRVRIRTSREKLRKSIQNFKIWCKAKRHVRLDRLFGELNVKLRGYYNYYGVKGNSKSLNEFFFNVMRILYGNLNQRSQRRSYNWNGFKTLIKHFCVAYPRLTEA
jgi:RNA-directed DNA polymerase